jgi:hypothetical protein
LNSAIFQRLIFWLYLHFTQTLFENLNSIVRLPISDSTYSMGVSICEFVHKFRHRTLQLVKLLLLQKRVCFAKLDSVFW